jgi:hypothetical protein
MRRRNSQNISAAGNAAAGKGFPAFAQNAKEHCGKARRGMQGRLSGDSLNLSPQDNALFAGFSNEAPPPWPPGGGRTLCLPRNFSLRITPFTLPRHIRTMQVCAANRRPFP